MPPTGRDRCAASARGVVLLGPYGWRAARERGELGAKGAPSRGRPADPDRALKARNEQLERENQRLRTKLEQAEAIIEVQKKLSTLLGLK